MKVLITGGTGLLGINLAGLLAKRGDDVTIISRGITESVNVPGNVTVLSSDMKDKNRVYDVVKGFEIVYHFAALIPHHGRENISADDMWKANVLMTENVMAAARHNGIHKIVFSSSMTVYDSGNNSPVSEDMPLLPVTEYALSKKTAEDLVRQYSSDGKVKGLIIRYPGLYGYPRNNGFLYNTVKRAMKNEDIFIKTKGLGFWEAMNVEDAAELTSKLTQSWDWSQNCETFNCSYGHEVDIVKTAYMIKDLLKSKSDITVEEPAGYKMFYMDNSKLKKYVDVRCGFNSGIRNFINSRKEWILK